jgi:hypothetical protein
LALIVPPMAALTIPPILPAASVAFRLFVVSCFSAIGQRLLVFDSDRYADFPKKARITL